MGKIISINGRARAGKDTIGKIIQDLTTPKPYKIEEDEFGGPLRDRKGDYVLIPEKSNWQVRKFATKLKIIAGILLGDPMFVTNWENSGKEYRNEFLPEWGMTRREFLLDLGTKAMRNNFHTDVHVISTFADYSYDQDWLITDMRFPNEYVGSENRGAITLRVNRHFKNIYPEKWAAYEKADFLPSENGFVNWLKEFDEETYKIVSHPSETSLVNHKFKYELDNNGTIADLAEQVKFVLKAENIL